MIAWPAVAVSPRQRVSSSHSRATRSCLKCCETKRQRRIYVVKDVSGHDCFCSLSYMMVIILGVTVLTYASIRLLSRPMGQRRWWWWCRCHRSPGPPSQRAMTSAALRQAGGLQLSSKALVSANIIFFAHPTHSETANEDQRLISADTITSEDYSHCCRGRSCV